IRRLASPKLMAGGGGRISEPFVQTIVNDQLSMINCQLGINDSPRERRILSISNPEHVES
ncbi:MAG: hypothetical protein KDC80_29025, partial [Saprospiraceae bacterium]|nr:hypothetical protein [Saprospiraceae bacterium]